MIENCSECHQFERGFLSEPNNCGWFQDYIHTPKRGIPIWCPKRYKGNIREQLIQLYTLEWIRKDHLNRLSELRFIPNVPQISKEGTAKLVQLVYSRDPIRADQLKEALEDTTEEKINKIWDQSLVSLKRHKI